MLTTPTSPSNNTLFIEWFFYWSFIALSRNWPLPTTVQTPPPPHSLTSYLLPQGVCHRRSCWPWVHTHRSHTSDTRGGRTRSLHSFAPWCTLASYRSNRTRSLAGRPAEHLWSSTTKWPPNPKYYKPTLMASER